MGTKTRGATALRKWRDANGQSQADVAEAVGCSQPTICHYELGLKRPGRTVADAIEALTDGAVSSSMWRTAAESRRIAAARPSLASLARLTSAA